MALYFAFLLGILLDPCLNIFGISIGVVLILEPGNYFDNSIGSLLCYSVELALGTLYGMLTGVLLGNYLGRSYEAFIGLP